MTGLRKSWGIYKGKGLARAKHFPVQIPQHSQPSQTSYPPAHENGTYSVFRKVGK